MGTLTWLFSLDCRMNFFIELIEDDKIFEQQANNIYTMNRNLKCV